MYKLSFAIVCAAVSIASAQIVAAPKPAPATATYEGGGTWRCTGTLPDPADISKQKASGLTLTGKLDAAKMWVVSTITGGFTGTQFVTFDAGVGRWERVMVNNLGVTTLSAPAPQRGVWAWTGTSTVLGQSPAKFRVTETFTTATAFKAVGESSSDNGTTWKKSYELTCKR